MHEHGKSDAAIIAKKPANKARKLVAEQAGPRVEAKGNAGQQRTPRARNRNRNSVFQAPYVLISFFD
jgi:hypothetical protein